MDKKCLLAAACVALIALAHPAHAQSASAVFNGPQNMDAGLQSGLNNLTGYVLFLPSCPKTFKASDIEILAAKNVGDTARRLPVLLKVTDSEACQ